MFGGTDGETRESVRQITEAHPVKTEIILHFGPYKINCEENEMVTLSDETMKPACEITEDDDVSNRWIKLKTQEL